MEKDKFELIGLLVGYAILTIATNNFFDGILNIFLLNTALLVFIIIFFEKLCDIENGLKGGKK